MRVAILGCGPSGLAALAGALDGGAEDVRVFSIKRKSELHGCQYLHSAIPGHGNQEVHHVKYRLRGTVEQYRHKVYGAMWDGTVSPEELEEDHRAWDIRSAYDDLWHSFNRYVYDAAQTSASVASHTANVDLVISSVHRPRLCHKGHTFGSRKIWAAGESPWVKLPYHSEDFSVDCNGLESPSWYRMARVFGVTTVEWPGELPKPPIGTVAEVYKPTFHNCDCWPGVLHVGRYGSWQKGYLVHQAYEDARNAVVNLQKEETRHG